MHRLEKLLTAAAILAAVIAGGFGLGALWMAEISFMPANAAQLCRIGLAVCGLALVLIVSSSSVSHRRLAREEG